MSSLKTVDECSASVPAGCLGSVSLADTRMPLALSATSAGPLSTAAETDGVTLSASFQTIFSI